MCAFLAVSFSVHIGSSSSERHAGKNLREQTHECLNINKGNMHTTRRLVEVWSARCTMGYSSYSQEGFFAPRVVSRSRCTGASNTRIMYTHTHPLANHVLL